MIDKAVSQEYEKIHANILHVLMEIPLLEDNSHLLSFVDNDEELMCAYIRGKDDKEVCAVLNLPTSTDKLFLTLSDGDPEKIARVLAHLEETDTKNCLHKNDILRFDYSYLQENNKIGVVLLSIKVSPVFNGLEHNMIFNGKKIQLMLVVFISQEEYDYRKKFGHDALMDYFSDKDKDLVSIAKLNQETV